MINKTNINNYFNINLENNSLIENKNFSLEININKDNEKKNILKNCLKNNNNKIDQVEDIIINSNINVNNTYEFKNINQINGQENNTSCVVQE